MAPAHRPVGPGARYFEDFRPGERIVTQGRTVTEVDGGLWAMFTGDMNPMHVDEVYATEHGLFGGRFPPGLMAVAIASGLKERLGLFAGTGLAMLEQTIRYHQPVRFGDTIHVELTVEETEPRPGKPRGVVTFHYEIVKDDGVRVADGRWVMVVAARPAREDPAP
ncbi:MAG: MaoC/PaaZ C-terminal domain-containing protein [Acidimicrobiia bacterium]|nr:MaoC/PaaZ C-terminal domain-containing protein [Acidimicrobiia bacterium]